MDIIKSAAQFEELCLSPIKQDSGCSNESDSDTSSQ